MALTRVLGVGEERTEGEAELLSKDEALKTALALATASALALLALLLVLLRKLLGLSAALGPLGVALGLGERRALAQAEGEALACTLAEPVLVPGRESEEAGEGETAAVAVVVAQAAAVPLFRPGLPLSKEVALTLMLRVASLLCESEAAPLLLGLPEEELEA